jgi:hypothetical protein
MLVLMRWKGKGDMMEVGYGEDGKGGQGFECWKQLK